MAILIKKESLLIITVVLYAVYFIIRTFIKKDNNGVMYNLIMIMIIAYFWALVSCTLLPILVPPVGIKNTNVNMNVLKIFEYKEMDVLLKNVVGNVILFMPLAYVLYFVIGKIPKMLHFLCASVLLSMLIELLQYLENISGLTNYTSRVTDIDDIILNVVGALIGYGLLLCGNKLLKKRDGEDRHEY